MNLVRQRPRRHARRRPNRHRDRDAALARVDGRGGATWRVARRLRGADGRGHGRRHGRGDRRADLRAVLHHQGGRQGHRPRPGHGLRHRPAARRGHPGLQRAGRGTTFSVYLPAQARSRRRLRAQRTSGRSRPAARETILLAEDDELVRSLTLRVLSNAGYEVLVARDGVEAIELFERNRERLDLALLNIGHAQAERSGGMRRDSGGTPGPSRRLQQRLQLPHTGRRVPAGGAVRAAAASHTTPDNCCGACGKRSTVAARRDGRCAAGLGSPSKNSPGARPSHRG